MAASRLFLVWMLLSMVQTPNPNLAMALPLEPDAASPDSVGEVAHHAGRLTHAQEALERSVVQLRTAGPAQEDALASSLLLLGLVQTEAAEYGPAAASLEEALKLRQGSPIDQGAGVAECLVALGRLHTLLGRFEQARAELEQALLLREQLYQAPHPVLAECLTALSNVHTMLAENEQAEARLAQAISMLEAGVGDHRLELADALEALGVLKLMTGRVVEAEAPLARGLALLREVLPDGHARLLQAEVRHAASFTYQGRTVEADALYDGLEGRIVAALGPAHPLLAELWENLCAQRFVQSRLEESAAIGARSIALSVRTFGEGHFSVANARLVLSRTYLYLGRYSDADREAETGSALMRELFGNQHYSTSIAINNLAAIRWQRGSYEEAISLWEESLRALQLRFGKAHPLAAMPMNNLALAYRTQSRYIEAEYLLRECLEINTKLHGTQHALVAFTLNNLAQTYADQGRYSDAEELFEQAIEIYLELPEHSTYELAHVYINRARNFADHREFDEAEASLLLADQVMKKDYGDAHPLRKNLWSGFAVLRTHQQRFDDAERFYADTLELLGSDRELNSIMARKMYTEKAMLSILRRDFKSAEEALDKSQRILRQQFRSDHPAITLNELLLAEVEAATGDLEGALARAQAAMRARLEAWYAAAGSSALSSLWQRHAQVQQTLSVQLSLPATGDAARVYSSVLGARGLILEQQMLRRLAARADAQTRDLFNAYRQSLHDYGPIEHESVPPGMGLEAQNAWRSDRRRRQENAWAEVMRREAALLEHSQAFSQARARRNLNARALASLLQSGEVLVDFFVYEHAAISAVPAQLPDERLVAFVVKPDGSVGRVELGAWGPIQAAILAWHESFASDRGLERAAVIRRKRAARVHDLLWAPLLPHVQSATRVLISPDRDVALVPFAALEGASAGSILLDELMLVQVPAPRLLGLNQLEVPGSALPNPNSGILIVSAIDYDRAAEEPPPPAAGVPSLQDPQALRSSADALRSSLSSQNPGQRPPAGWRLLPGMVAEGQAVDALYQELAPGTAREHLTGAAATEAALVSHAMGKRHLHIATHGYFEGSPSGPNASHRPDALSGWLEVSSLSRPRPVARPAALRSGLVLAGANAAAHGQQDGLFSAWELAAADLSGVELAVLASCDGSQGQSTSGDGLLSLQRALQAAGVKASITSLWPVRDAATQLLMGRLYRSLLTRSLEPAAALLEAQRWLKGPDGRSSLAAHGALLLDSEGAVHPALWAGWILAGEGQPGLPTPPR